MLSDSDMCSGKRKENLEIVIGGGLGQLDLAQMAGWPSE